MQLLIRIALLLGSATPSLAQVYNDVENLLVRIPPGFVQTHADATETQVIEEFIPVEQTQEAWQEMITLQLFPTLGGQPPTAFLTRMADQVSATCPDGQVGPISELSAGHYPAALVVATCPESLRTDGAETFVAYAIGGADRLYVLQYAWARRPEPEDFEAARAFFATAMVCDTVRPGMPCPEGD